jgi:poly(A) polymerase
VTQPEFLTDPALVRVWNALPDARVVGGAVRDTLADRPVADIDMATPQTPVHVIVALKQAGLKVVPTGLAHGTVTAVAGGRPFEITTLRRDVETDGRHAVVAFTQDWRLDAARRDFTINAMSMARDGTIHDYFDGTADMRAGRIRFVGDPATRIAEDYLRILRFFRFYARYARISPDPATLDDLHAGIPGLADLSVERVWMELRRILAAPDPDEAIALMRRLGVLGAILPEAGLEPRLAGLPPDPILRLAAMLAADPLPVATRLKMSHEERDRLIRLAATPAPSGSEADLRRLLAGHLPEDLIARTWLDDLPDIRTRLTGMERPVFPLEGRHVVAMGIPAGPRVGALLRDVRQWWMDGGCTAGTAACLAKLAQTIDPSKMDAKR